VELTGISINKAIPADALPHFDGPADHDADVHTYRIDFVSTCDRTDVVCTECRSRLEAADGGAS
jgi:hypothetical protein